MKPAPFDLLLATDLDEALKVLAEAGDDAKLIAGGQSLVPMLNMRLLRPALLVDIAGIASLKYIRNDGPMLEIGACTTQAELERSPGLAGSIPLMAAALPHVGHMQTRNRGTVCGSLCHADPSSELPLLLLALGGEVVARNRRRRRKIKAEDFIIGMLSTALEPDEIAIAARYPVARDGHGYAFREVARRHGDFAIVALAAVVSASSIRLGVGGVADTPVTREWSGMGDGSELDDALNELAWELGGSDDIHATARYRRELVRRLGRKTIEDARRCLD